MFGMRSQTRTVPPQADDLRTVLRVLRKHTRILSNMHHDGNEGYETLLKAVKEVENKVDTCIGDVRAYRKEQRDLSGRLALVEEHLAAAK